MSTTTTTPTTAAGLLDALRPYDPAVEDGELVFPRDPAPALDAVLTILHTGVRARLTGRTWFGCGSTVKTAAPRPLDANAPIPAGITLLCVEGDRRWDRIDPAAFLDLPRVFLSE